MASLLTKIHGIYLVLLDAVAFPERPAVNFSGGGITVVDNPAKNRTDITLPDAAQAVAAIVPLPELLSAISGYSRISILYAAPHDSAVKVNRIDLLSGPGLVSSDTNFAIAEISDSDEGGTAGSTLANFATLGIGGGGTGDWGANKLVWSWVPTDGYTLAAGHMLRVSWSTEGTGADIFGGSAWRIS